VWETAAQCLPTSREDAKTQMSVLCSFLAWTDRKLGSIDLGQVLTRDNVNRYLRHYEGRVPDHTLQNRAGRLRRAMRVAAGEAPRTVRGARKSAAAPYSPAELEALKAAAADPGSVLRTVVDSMLGAAPDAPPADTATCSAAEPAAAAVGVQLDRQRAATTRSVSLLTRPGTPAGLLRTAALSRSAADGALEHLPQTDEGTTRNQLRG
jgi:hypothetical protein